MHLIENVEIVSKEQHNEYQYSINSIFNLAPKLSFLGENITDYVITTNSTPAMTAIKQVKRKNTQF